MKLIDRIRIFKEVIELETEGKVDGYVIIEKDSLIVLLDEETINLKDTWLNQYIKRNDYSELRFDDSVLFCDVINNFQSYSRSKRGIKKFNL